jgi:hypothetical protein
MNTFKSDEILPRLNAAQLKSLLRLTDTIFTSKMNKEELCKIALTVSEITPAIIINHLKLDKFAMEKKLSKPIPKPKVKKGGNIFDPEQIEENSPMMFDESALEQE